MSWMDDWRAAEQKRRAAAQARKFSPDKLAVTPTTAGSALEELRVAVMEQEKKYAGRWGFYDSLKYMGRKNGQKEIGASSDAKRERAQADSGRVDAASAADEPPESVA